MGTPSRRRHSHTTLVPTQPLRNTQHWRTPTKKRLLKLLVGVTLLAIRTKDRARTNRCCQHPQVDARQYPSSRQQTPLNTKRPVPSAVLGSTCPEPRRNNPQQQVMASSATAAATSPGVALSSFLRGVKDSFAVWSPWCGKYFYTGNYRAAR